MESSKPILTSFQSTDTLHSTSTLVDSSNGQEKSKLDTQNDDRAPGNVPIEATRIDKTEEIDVVPDGGFRAWLVIFGITCCTFTTFGLTSSWGFFQAYYQQSLLKSSSPSTIAWIGSIQYALAFLPCMIVGRLFDLGYFHSIFAGASMVLVLAIMLVAQCTVYWQLLLCQGFLTGLACGIIVGPTTAILAQWFKEKRALALGFTATGSALGGTLLPVTARALLPRIGFSWTVRVIGFIALTCLLLANLTIRRRLPPTYPKGPLLSVKPLKSIPFVTYCIATLLVYFGLYTFMTYVASTAVLNSVPEIFSFNLVAIMNGSSGIGRLAAGIIGNRIGPMNHMIPSTVVSGLIILAWPAVRSQSAFIAIVVVFGAGSYSALLWQPVLDLGDADELSRRVGIMMLFLACAGLLGPPTSGEVNKAAGMQAMSIYAGGCTLVGVALALVARHMVLKKVFGKI